MDGNENNGKIPWDFWLEDWERQAIIEYHTKNPLEGYRRLAFMMLDADVVAVSPTTVYRVLRSAVRTSPYYPLSNGKMERWNRTMKSGSIRRFPPSDVAGARRVIGTFVDHYNHVRLHSAIGYVTPAALLAGREQEIWEQRDRKLEAARAKRQSRRRGLEPLRCSESVPAA